MKLRTRISEKLENNHQKYKKLDKFHLVIRKDGIYRFWFLILKRIFLGDCIYCGITAPKFKLGHKHDYSIK